MKRKARSTNAALADPVGGLVNPLNPIHYGYFEDSGLNRSVTRVACEGAEETGPSLLSHMNSQPNQEIYDGAMEPPEIENNSDSVGKFDWETDFGDEDEINTLPEDVHEEREHSRGLEPDPRSKSKRKYSAPSRKKARTAAQPDPFTTALERFRQIAPDTSDKTLEDCLQAALKSDENVKSNTIQWVDEAQMHLAIANEIEEEAAKLRVAMKESSDQIEAEKVRQQEEEAQLGKAASLERKFNASLVLQPLKEICNLSVLVDSPAGEPLGKLLTLEKSCKRWYEPRGVGMFFGNLGSELSDHLQRLLSEHRVRQSLREPVSVTSSGPSGEAAGEGTSTTQASGQLSQIIGTEACAALSCLAQVLGEKEKMIQWELARMPDNAAQGHIFIPSIFRLPPGLDQREEIECLSD